MKIGGNIIKMKTEYLNEKNLKSLQEVQYFLPIGETFLSMNELIGTPMELVFEGQINCRICKKKTKKSFGQGSCYTCFMTSPQNAECILHPELCEAHLGKGRDVNWEEKNHNREHIVYLAKSSAIKVGVTGDFPMTRWVDQGASQAIILAKTPYRQLAGEIEVLLKSFYTDKTNWRNMLKNLNSDQDLLEEKECCYEYLPEDYHQFIDEEDQLYQMNFPMQNFPNKIKSIGFDKKPIIQGVLQGIKGQYLYFEDGKVLNIRKHTGYYISINY